MVLLDCVSHFFLTNFSLSSLSQTMQGIPVAYDTALPQNGVNMNVGTPLSVPYTRFGAQPVGSYAMPGSQWVSGYMMAQPMAQVDDQVSQSVCFANTTHVLS